MVGIMDFMSQAHFTLLGLQNKKQVSPLLESLFWDFPSGPVVGTSLSNAGVWVQSLATDLRPHMPHDQ